MLLSNEWWQSRASVIPMCFIQKPETVIFRCISDVFHSKDRHVFPMYFRCISFNRQKLCVSDVFPMYFIQKTETVRFISAILYQIPGTKYVSPHNLAGKIFCFANGQNQGALCWILIMFFFTQQIQIFKGKPCQKWCF